VVFKEESFLKTAHSDLQSPFPQAAHNEPTVFIGRDREKKDELASHYAALHFSSTQGYLKLDAPPVPD